jgi:sugar O-acyltransferase (sialic acid O-acetyltransferase NeuD family)
MISYDLKPESFVSSRVIMGDYNIVIDVGCTIMAGSILTTCIQIKKGTLVNIHCTIGHDTVIGEFCEICPGVHISGSCTIGDEVFIGTGAVILPGLKIGNGSVVAAGSVVTDHVPENVMVAGVPAQIKKQWQKD